MKFNPGKKSSFIFSAFIVIFFTGLQTPALRCQTTPAKKINYDTNYIETFPQTLTTRLYSSIKYTHFNFINTQKNKTLFYNNNSNYILGVGVTYSLLTINIGLNFNFVNHDDDRYGPSEYLDLQTHIFSRKVSIDLYIQWYDGFFIVNPDQAVAGWDHPNRFPQRPDIKTYNFGYNIQYLFNSKKFSYPASYIHNEYQKKSAGTWVIGSNSFFMIVEGDSAINRPGSDPEDLFGSKAFHRTDMLNIGISGGYYYTLVIAKHIFLSLGLAIGPGMGFSWLDYDETGRSEKTGLTLGMNGLLRSSAGYNGRKIFVGISLLHQMVWNQLPVENIWEFYSTGNLRVNFVYRFKLKKPIKFLDPGIWEK